MKLALAITNHKHRSSNNNINFLIFTYQNNGHIILLNNWNNSKYFTAFFLILFCFNIRDHLYITNSLKKEKKLFKA